MTQKILRRRGKGLFMALDTFTTYATPKSIYTETLTPHTAPIERICGNCKHWERAEDVGRGYYQAEGFCKNPKLDLYILDIDDNPEVRENFGCVPLWEAKESEVAEGK